MLLCLTPPPRYNVITSAFYRVKNTLFPRPLFVGTLMTGSNLAGLPDRGDETASLASSNWINLVTNLQTGNHLVTASLLNVNTASGLPLALQLAHNSMNASIDVGVGKGWMTNLHTCVSEDGQSGDITYMDPSGALYVFSYDSQTQTYANPKGFAGKLTKEANGEYTLQGLNHTKQVFGTDGKLTTVSEVCGTNPDTIDIVYNANGNPISATDSLSGRAITLTWDANQKLSSIQGPMSNTWSFTQNGSNQLTTITQPQDNSQTPPPTRPTTTFSYDGNNLITGHDDFLGDSYEIGYEASSPYKVTSWTDPASNVTSFSYAAATTPYDKKTTVTDAENIAVDYFFGASSKQLEKIEQTDATTLKIEMGYNATTGFQTTSKDSYGNTTTMAYDSVGHLISVTPPAGAAGQPSYVKTFTYSTPVSIDSNVTQVQETVTAQVDATTSIAYTDANNPCLPTSITDPLNQVTTKSYNSNGQITSLVQPTTGGTKTTSFSYSLSTKDLSIITDALSNDTQYLRNMNGQVAEIKKYDGSTSTGTLKVDDTIAIGQLGYSLGTSDSVSGLTSSITKDDNGATLSSTSKLGCISSKSLKNSAQVTMPNNVDLRAPSGAIGSIITPTIPAPTFPIMPYNPSPSSSTNSKNQTSNITYFNNGKTNTIVNHLGQTTTISYDSFGRTDVVTDPFGKTTTYGYNLNSQTTSKAISGVGTTTYVYDDARRLTQITEPVKGTNIRSMNLRGNLYSDTYSSYSRDILGRLLSKTFIAGGTETYSYSPEGYKTNDNGIIYSYDAIGNVTSKNGTAFTYTGASGSTQLGLPSSSTNQSYTYGGNHFLSSLTDTSKSPSLPFQYSYSGSKELLFLNNSNQTQLQQVFVNKSITQQTYVNTQTMTQFSQINQGFNANDQLTSHQYSIATGTTPFTETISMTYNALNKLNTTTYSSNNKVLTYNYNATGKLSTLNVSGLGNYVYNYSPTDGTISSVTYPNQTRDVYTYNGPKGRLSQILYPNGDTVSLNWNGNMQVQTLTYTAALTTDVYSFLYDGKDRTTRFILTQNGIQSFLWDFTYDALGVKTATKTMNGQTAITHVFTTDTKGRPLSTTYTDNTCQTGCFSGEAFLNWDPCGNLTSMTASNGTLVASYEYDKAYSKKINEYNPYGVEMPFQYKGRDGTVTPTYGGATPLNVDMHIYSGSRISIGNLAPVQAPDKLVCYIDGYSEDPMSPVDGGSEDDCDDEEDDCDVDCEKGYKEGFTSVTDLCRCKESEGKVPGFRYGDVKDLDCDGLKEMMANEKADWEYHVNGEETGDLDKDDKYHGKIENLVDVLFYIGNPNKDYSCGTLARSGCLYWSAKEALEKKIASGECQ